MEVGSHNRVEDTLTVSLVHNEEGLHLKAMEQTIRDRYWLF